MAQSNSNESCEKTGRLNKVTKLLMPSQFHNEYNEEKSKRQWIKNKNYLVFYPHLFFIFQFHIHKCAEQLE